MDFSDLYNSDVRVKKEPNDVSPIENEDYMKIDNARNAKTDEFSSFCRENLIYGLRKNDENSGPNNDLEIEFECKDEKLSIDLLVVKKTEDDYPDQWQHMKNSCDYQTQKKIKEEIVDEVKEELNLDGELSDAFDGNGKTFAQNSQRKTQTDKARNRTKYPCNICSKKFALKDYLKVHIDSIHIDAMHNDMAPTCEICGKKFPTKDKLKIHIDGVHNGVKHACGTCEKIFTQKWYLKIHIDAMHNGMALTCEVCGKKFAFKSGLKLHMDAVHNKITHACDTCGKIFTMKDTLKKHINATHKGMAPTCEVCGKKFVLKCGLKLHMDAVHNKITHACDTCGKIFTMKDTLKKHINATHKGMAPTCEVCRKKFAFKSGLKLHMDTVHNKITYAYTSKVCMKAIPKHEINTNDL
ncbi:zinc finger protein draculin-like [Trichogramma pretiosum]|uniref:zinc finger protein draculin-like n=1 Tax=Trichogramma pretiosum TaxID=7493 RepID=UPI000C71AFE0|nr:zinc finger protein draculin-like [Trichogramma pretiosum]